MQLHTHAHTHTRSVRYFAFAVASSAFDSIFDLRFANCDLQLKLSLESMQDLCAPQRILQISNSLSACHMPHATHFAALADADSHCERA